MNIQTLTNFFMWCTIMNGVVLTFWTIMLMLAPDLVYRTQNKFFPVSRETFNIIIYLFLGLFKIVFVTLSLVPYVALVIVG